MSIRVARSTHSQSNNANDDDENGNECDDTADNSDYQSVVVAHGLLDLRHFCLNFCGLSDGNAPDDVRFLSRWSCEDSR